MPYKIYIRDNENAHFALKLNHFCSMHYCYYKLRIKSVAIIEYVL